MTGPVLGIGAFVAVMGLTATASGQISNAFSVLTATQVTVTDAGPASSDGTVESFPNNADAIIGSLNGVVDSGISWTLPGATPTVTTSLDPRAGSSSIPVIASTAGYLRAAEAHASVGSTISTFEEQANLHVAVLGASVARQLNIHDLQAQPSVAIDGLLFTVVGIVDAASRDPGVASSIYIPATTARQIWGPPSSITPARMLIHTRLGAAALISKQAAIALRPDMPTVLAVTPPVEPSVVQGQVSTSLAALFLALAGLVLLIGATAIANTTLVAVIERTPEIGLRRSLGARPLDIGMQFLTESAAIGAIGGLIGTALGTAVVVGSALVNSWTAIMNPAITLAGPMLGTIVGILAGVYPARRASHIQPVKALRQG